MSRTYIPNAWPLGTTYHVAQQHPDASDTNPGAEALPFETISAAAMVARKYDRVMIGEGIYREQVPITQEGDRNIPGSWVVFSAVPGQEVYLKGSDIFDADWDEVDPGIHRAALPETLFDNGVYNPYALACVPPDCPVNYEFDRGGYDPGTWQDPCRTIRPTTGDVLPETLGQIYVDHEALAQVDSLQAIRETPGSFVISSDGRWIICHFVNEESPSNKFVELTVRERCFKPQFVLHWGGLMIQTVGIVAEHAADPGAFSRCRPLFIRRNSRSGITVRKTFHAHCSISGSYVTGGKSYLGTGRPTMLSYVRDGTRPHLPSEQPTVVVTSDDDFRTWTPLEDGPLAAPIANYFLDEDNGMLLRHYRQKGDGNYYDDKSEEQHGPQKLVLQVSRDSGRTWGAAEELDFGDDIVCFTLMKLADGKLLWMIEENHPSLSPVADLKPDAIFFACRAWLGSWRSDLSGIDWEQAGLAQIPNSMGSQGVGEPQVCQLSDGRIFAIFRQAIILPSQHAPGYPSVKLFSVSENNGRTWSDPEPLLFEDGEMAYSSTSFASCIRSSKNDRVYAILNIVNGPNEGCLPRNVLHIAEINQDTFRVKRDTVTVIEEVHEEHTSLVGYSNWGMFEERDTKNLALFMNLENGPVNDGYDWNAYRYEVAFPEADA